jgi:peptidoglycan biosynthesis protein MviN/MurJ (putative lipid II flippase)
VLAPLLGLAAIPLSAALTFTMQAIVLLTILNRRFPGLLRLESTGVRAAAAALAAGIAASCVLLFLPVPGFAKILMGLIAGGLAAIPLVWREVRLLFNL